MAYSYNLMLHDLSFANSNVIFTYLEFSRAEIKRLVEMSAYINKKVGDKISESPLCGLIKLTLRQLILKSRNNYDTSRIYKSISTKNLKLALSNHQVWMSKIERLNDESVWRLWSRWTVWLKRVNVSRCSEVLVRAVAMDSVVAASNSKRIDKSRLRTIQSTFTQFHHGSMSQTGSKHAHTSVLACCA